MFLKFCTIYLQINETFLNKTRIKYKRMNMKKILLPVILAIVSLVSCQKEDINIPTACELPESTSEIKIEYIPSDSNYYIEFAEFQYEDQPLTEITAFGKPFSNPDITFDVSQDLKTFTFEVDTSKNYKIILYSGSQNGTDVFGEFNVYIDNQIYDVISSHICIVEN